MCRLGLVQRLMGGEHCSGRSAVHKGPQFEPLEGLHGLARYKVFRPLGVLTLAKDLGACLEGAGAAAAVTAKALGNMARARGIEIFSSPFQSAW